MMQEEIKQIKEIDGEVRGLGIKNVLDFISEKRGKEGVEKTKEEMEKLGFILDYDNISLMRFYSIQTYLMLTLISKRFLGFGDKEFQEMGDFMAKSSLILRLLLRHFASLDNTVVQAPRAWRKYFSVGALDVPEIDRENKYILFTLKEFNFDPLHCQITTGFLSATIQMVLNKKVNVEEKRCFFRGDDYHEFLVSW
ncbi:MAG: hypothetical protein GF370_00010 [Candidatus Nealsonbacteria bacterium]|nr:hypothetical protein [Candidatus Nealsonbacteria bacterium]